MRAKSVLTGALILSLLGLGSARSQTPPGKSGDILPPPRVQEGPVPGSGPFVPHETYPLSPWITYHRDCCWGEMNGNPLLSEIYFRSGVSLPTGGDAIGKLMDTGWTIGGGARALFFNAAVDRAWTIDASITNTINYINRPDSKFTLDILLPIAPFGTVQRVDRVVTLQDYNRTTVNLSLGRERYLWGPAKCGARSWRWGWDAGGRYGSASAAFNEIRHRTDVIGGLFVALHSDLEFPCGGCTFFGGFRAEWGYTWGDILQRASDVSDVNLLVTLGVRF